MKAQFTILFSGAKDLNGTLHLGKFQMEIFGQKLHVVKNVLRKVRNGNYNCGNC